MGGVEISSDIESGDGDVEDSDSDGSDLDEGEKFWGGAVTEEGDLGGGGRP